MREILLSPLNLHRAYPTLWSILPGEAFLSQASRPGQAWSRQPIFTQGNFDRKGKDPETEIEQGEYPD